MKDISYIDLLKHEKTDLLRISQYFKVKDPYESADYTLSKLALCINLLDIIIYGKGSNHYVNIKNLHRFFNSKTTELYKREIAIQHGGEAAYLWDVRFQKALFLYNKIRTQYMVDWML